MSDYNNFLNTYDFQPETGFDSREKQIADAGVNTEPCLQFGYGYYDCDNPPQPTKGKCLTFTAEEGNSAVSMSGVYEGEWTLSFEYSTDGENWTTYTLIDKGDGKVSGMDKIVLKNVGDFVQFRGVNPQMGGDDEVQNIGFQMKGRISASGDVTSLINGVGGNATLNIFCFSYMFYGCTALTAAPSLPSKTLASSCYEGMFYKCTSLTTPPVLPATTLASSCYSSMFGGCTSLTAAPALPATTLVDNCYYDMFNGCTSLNYIKAMFLTNPEVNRDYPYTSNWVYGVSRSGTFVKNAAAEWNVDSDNGVPVGWTVETAAS